MSLRQIGASDRVRERLRLNTSKDMQNRKVHYIFKSITLVKIVILGKKGLEMSLLWLPSL